MSKLHGIRSKARVKRILKHEGMLLDMERGVIDIPCLKKAIRRLRIRSVSWREIVAHNIHVEASDGQGAYDV